MMISKENKKLLDAKIEENSIDIGKYKYRDYSNEYVRFEKDSYSGRMYKLALDKKGYLTERYSSDEPGVCDSKNITVFNKGERYFFSTMDESYEYECKDGNLYYVGHDGYDVYGSVYSKDENEGKFCELLHEDMNKNTFEEKKQSMLSEFMEKTKGKSIEQLDETREDKDVGYVFESAYASAMKNLSDVMPDDGYDKADEYELPFY